MTIKHLLNKEQKEFIKKHKISEDLLYDANGEGLSEDLLRNMSEMKKALAYNVTGCGENPEHNFLTIGGHYPQSDLEKIPFALREYKTGYIYIAGSKKGELMIVGSSNETKDRVTINTATFKYGGYDDWELLFHAKTDTLGRVERLVQEKLVEYKAAYQYEKGGKLQNGGDLYRCSYNKAKDAIADLQNEGHYSFSQENEKKHLTPEYQFKNLIVRSNTKTIQEA